MSRCGNNNFRVVTVTFVFEEDGSITKRTVGFVESGVPFGYVRAEFRRYGLERKCSSCRWSISRNGQRPTGV